MRDAREDLGSMPDLRPRSSLERWLYAAAALLLVLGLGARPLLRTLTPQLAVDGLAFLEWPAIERATIGRDELLGAIESGPRDPWGRPWRFAEEYDDRETLGRAWLVSAPAPARGARRVAALVSLGPSGEPGRGTAIVARIDVRQPALTLMAAAAPWLFVALAATILWWIPSVRRPRGHWLRELSLIVVMGFPVFWATVIVLLWSQDSRLTEHLFPAAPIAVVPPVVVVCGSVGFAVALLGLALRLVALRQMAPVARPRVTLRRRPPGTDGSTTPHPELASERTVTLREPERERP